MRTIEMAISKSNIENQVAALLYATGVFNDKDDIKSIEFGDMNGDQVQIKVKFKKEQEGKLIIPNG